MDKIIGTGLSGMVGSRVIELLSSGYDETDQPHPINWYGLTKYEGEKIVQNLKNGWLIIRIAYPYRTKFTQKLDFVRSILAKFKKKEPVLALTDQIFTPTFIDDIALTIKFLIKQKITGLYHLVGSQFLTPYQAINFIVDQFNLDYNRITGVKMDEYYQGRAPRPKNLALRNDKIKKLGIKMRSFEEGIKEVKRQM